MHVSIDGQNPKSSDQFTADEDGGLVSRNITVGGHRTSVRLEPSMWHALREICQRERASMHRICTVIADNKPANGSLTAAIRVFVMVYFRSASTEDGHNRAGHGPGGEFMMGMKVRESVARNRQSEDKNNYAAFIMNPRLLKHLRKNT